MSETNENNDDLTEKTSGRRFKVFGCGTQLFLAGALMLAGGIYLMNGWEQLPGPGKAGAVVLVVLGTLMLLPFLIFAGGWVIFRVFIKKMTQSLKNSVEEMTKAAGTIVADNKAMYGKIHEFRSAVNDDFASLDRTLYDQTERALANLGYRYLGDVVDRTIEETAGVTAVIRVMASTNGAATAGFYDISPIAARANLPAGTVVIDMTTEFKDGTFYLTSSSEGLDLTTTATGIDRRQYPPQTPAAELAGLHEAELQKLLAVKGSDACVIIDTLSDALESEKRQQAIKNSFRAKIGYVDPEEVRRIAKNIQDEDDEEKDITFSDLAADVVDKARQSERQN